MAKSCGATQLGADRFSYPSPLIVVVIMAILPGCATPPTVKEKASSILKTVCMEMFDGRFQRFQLNIRPPIFALAVDGDGQACGMAAMIDAQDSFMTMGTSQKIETIAIARCEAAKPASVKAPCKVFARGNEIVWDKKLNIGLE